jgi:hypothetical protein
VIPGVLNGFSKLRPASGHDVYSSIELTVAASQTIKPYDILSLSSGAAQQSIATPSAGTFSLSGGNLPIVGAAEEAIVTNASGQEVTAGQIRTTVPVMLFDDRGDILLQICGANGVGITLSSFTQGLKYQFGRFTNAAGTNTLYALSATTTNGEMVLREITQDFQGDTTTNYATVWCHAALSSTIRQMG